MVAMAIETEAVAAVAAETLKHRGSRKRWNIEAVVTAAEKYAAVAAMTAEGIGVEFYLCIRNFLSGHK